MHILHILPSGPLLLGIMQLDVVVVVSCYEVFNPIICQNFTIRPGPIWKIHDKYYHSIKVHTYYLWLVLGSIFVSWNCSKQHNLFWKYIFAKDHNHESWHIRNFLNTYRKPFLLFHHYLCIYFAFSLCLIRYSNQRSSPWLKRIWKLWWLFRRIGWQRYYCQHRWRENKRWKYRRWQCNWGKKCYWSFKK